MLTSKYSGSRVIVAKIADIGPPGGMFANSIRARAHSHGHAHDCRHAHARGYYHGHKREKLSLFSVERQ